MAKETVDRTIGVDVVSSEGTVRTGGPCPRDLNRAVKRFSVTRDIRRGARN